MISLYFANPGAGKTSYIAKLAQKYNSPTLLNKTLNKLTKGKIKLSTKYDKVYCNVPIYNTYIYDVDKDMGVKHIENSLILIDEGAIVLDNRIPLKDAQKTFLRLHRHYKCDIIVVSQSWEDINIVVRRLYDKIYLMNKTFIPHLTVYRKIHKLIEINDDGQIIEAYRFALLGIRFLYRKPYYKYFNSYDRPQLKSLPSQIYKGKLAPNKITQKFNQLLAFIKNPKVSKPKAFKSIEKHLKKQEEPI